MVHLTLVVARYQESTQWAVRYPHVVIYSKGTTIPGAISLPNVGREAHTYLHHILATYDSPAPYTAFLQGNPFDHSPNLIRQLDTYQTLASMPDFFHISEVLLPTMSEEDPFHRAVPLREYYTLLFGETPRRDFQFGAGAQFLVSARAIRSIPKAVYQTLYDKVVSDTRTPGGAHALERLWELLFTARLDSTVALHPRWVQDNPH